MHITKSSSNMVLHAVCSQKTYKKIFWAGSLLMLGGVAMAHDEHHHNLDAHHPSVVTSESIISSEMNDSNMNHLHQHDSQMHPKPINSQSMNATSMSQVVTQHPHTLHDSKQGLIKSTQHKNASDRPVEHLQHQTEQHNSQNAMSTHTTHDHRKEHGAQRYTVSTFDQKWMVNEAGEGALKSELEIRTGSDENKMFFKAHIDKHESKQADYALKLLYSRMISDFWDAQMGVRYRAEEVERDHQDFDHEEKLDAVVGMHGLAPYFFETDAYVYVGEDNYAGMSLETERDLLLTQRLVVQPYLNIEAVFSDRSKYAKKTGLSSVTTGIETRYEINKNIMPYIDVAYEYTKGKDATAWQMATDAKKGWLYGVGVRFKF